MLSSWNCYAPMDIQDSDALKNFDSRLKNIHAIVSVQKRSPMPKNLCLKQQYSLGKKN